MTCIAVKVKDGNIEMAGDTQTSWGANKFPKNDTSDKHIKANGKMFEVNGMTLGCAGSCADIGLLQIFSKTHSPKEMERDDILNWFIEFKEWAFNKAKINFSDISIHGIIIRDKRAFVFYDFMEVNEIRTFDAVGSGMWIALGAMEVGASASVAVECAIKYDKGCGGSVTEYNIN